MATILAHIQLRTGDEAQFEALCRDLFAASQANEPGLLRYEYWRGQSSGQYYCLLAFSDFESFLTHQTSAHHEAASASLMAAISDLRLEWLDPVDGAAPLPATNEQHPRADGDELRQRYAALFPVRLADWWAPLRAQAPPSPLARPETHPETGREAQCTP